MKDDKDIYDKHFFDRAREMEAPSAGAAVEILMKRFSPVSVVDVGCGQGIYLEQFARRGIEIKGYDSAPAAFNGSLVGDKIEFHDLRFPLISYRKFSLCLCLEVAEHLPFSSSEILARTLTNLSDAVAFSAATPGQGSADIGHINEQPHDFWIYIFRSLEFAFDVETTAEIRKEMKERNVIWWVAKNLMIFKKNKII